jgi:hypothetical protein
MHLKPPALLFFDFTDRIRRVYMDSRAIGFLGFLSLETRSKQGADRAGKRFLLSSNNANDAIGSLIKTVKVFNNRCG